MLVAQALAATVRSGNSGLSLLEEFRIKSLTCPSKLDTAHPTQLTLTGSDCSHQPGHSSQEFHISNARASQTRAFTTGSPALYQLSYGTGYAVVVVILFSCHFHSFSMLCSMHQYTPMQDLLLLLLIQMLGNKVIHQQAHAFFQTLTS